MKKIALLVGVSLAMTASCRAQVAKLFPGGSALMDRAQLLKTYSGVESEIPKWEAEAKTMQPRPEDAYALGLMVVTERTDLLKTLGDLHKTLEVSKDEDFGNQWEVAFVECRVRDDLDRIGEDFDSYTAALTSSSASKREQGKFIIQNMHDIQTYATASRLLRIDLENRLHDRAVFARKTRIERTNP